MRLFIVLLISVVVLGVWLLTSLYRSDSTGPDLNPSITNSSQVSSKPAKNVFQEKEHTSKNHTLNSPPAKAQQKKQYQERYQLMSLSEDYPTLEGRIQEMSRRRPNTTYKTEDVLDALEKNTAWEVSNEISSIMTLSHEEQTDGREFIKFNSLKIETLMPGDTLMLPIHEAGEDFEIVIDSIFHNSPNALTWHGHLKNDMHSLIQITQSSKLTLGVIETPKGQFVLQAHDGAGWIASEAVLDKRDYSQTDAIVPENY